MPRRGPYRYVQPLCGLGSSGGRRDADVVLSSVLSDMDVVGGWHYVTCADLMIGEQGEECEIGV